MGHRALAIDPEAGIAEFVGPGGVERRRFTFTRGFLMVDDWELSPDLHDDEVAVRFLGEDRPRIVRVK